ncbi:MAG: hypothetical protein OXE76_05505 [Alphaproteobacteria bacterium]|nr:hypothetical protein [Alphaproteobacteria bacterium]
MPTRLAFAAVALAACGAAQADSTTFNTVPANIADAPVKEWRGVERRDQSNVSRWQVRFRGGSVWIAAIHPGKYWQAWSYQSESRALKAFRKDGFDNFRRVESTAYAGSQWGYMALAERGGADCMVGVVLDQDNLDHDGSNDGGRLRAYAYECTSGAVGRFDDWLTWFRSFKRVPLGYNAHLDR